MPERRSTVARRIEQIREVKKLSRQELADRLKTTRLQVWRIERGVTELSAADVPSWAEALGVSIASLYREGAA